MPEVSVAVLAGDGIGPEVVAEARRVVDAIAPDHGLGAWLLAREVAAKTLARAYGAVGLLPAG